MNSAVAGRLETRVVETSASRSGEWLRSSPLVAGICMLLFFGVLSFGAVEEWSLSTLEVGFMLLLVVWAVRQAMSGKVTIQSSPLYAPGILFGAVVIIQLVFNITAYRYVTFISALEYLAFGILLFLTINTVNNERSAKIALWSLTSFGFALAAFAIVQDLTSNGKIYWLRTLHDGGWMFGPYVDHDHYAGMMEMVAPVPIVVALSSLLYGGRRVLVGFAGVLMASSIVLSQSRAGAASFLAEIALLLGIGLTKRDCQNKGRRAVAVSAWCLFVLAFVAWVGTATMWQRFTDLSYASRLAMTKDGLRMFWQKPVLGWGLGTFTTVYPQFRSFYTTRFVNAAHNDYVQLLVETGVVGFAAMVWFVLALYRSGLHNADGWNRSWSKALGLSTLIGCTGLLVHSAFDFNLQIPANACLFYFLCGVTTNTARLADKAARPGAERKSFDRQFPNRGFARLSGSRLELQRRKKFDLKTE